MKLVVIMFLEDDTSRVRKLLAQQEINLYSELSMVGHGSGTPGWYGEAAPYRSRMFLSFLPVERADALVRAIEGCTDCSPDNPIRAWLMDVERTVSSQPTNT
jgi:hypothetical protein